MSSPFFAKFLDLEEFIAREGRYGKQLRISHSWPQPVGSKPEEAAQALGITPAKPPPWNWRNGCAPD